MMPSSFDSKSPGRSVALVSLLQTFPVCPNEIARTETINMTPGTRKDDEKGSTSRFLSDATGSEKWQSRERGICPSTNEPCCARESSGFVTDSELIGGRFRV